MKKDHNFCLDVWLLISVQFSMNSYVIPMTQKKNNPGVRSFLVPGPQGDGKIPQTFNNNTIRKQMFLVEFA